MTLLYKVSGGGNDFLVLPEPAEPAPPPERIRAWCRRGLSLGADGLFLLHRAGVGRVRMDYRNADGAAAELCLNGTRCAARLAFHLGWAAGEVEVLTGAGSMAARQAGANRVCLELPEIVAAPSALEVEAEGERFAGWRVEVGVPHFVLPWPEGLARAPVARLGALLRRHPAFGAAGTNVDFVRYAGSGQAELRSFERGVEAETLACGTGVVAAAAVGVASGRATLPLAVLTAGGFVLEVGGGGRAAPDGAAWTLAGDARVVARVEPDPGAEELAPAPAWR
jgi:diaminopimelate epimerase